MGYNHHMTMTTANPDSCTHATCLRVNPVTGEVHCPCGAVWLDRAAVQARNHKVARSVMQLLGTLIGGSKAPAGK